MRGTALLYSSHNRCNFIHDHYIAQRALAGRDNKRVLFLPMSEAPRDGNERERQEFAYGNFSWFFRFYERFGLEHVPFYWTSSLRREDVDVLWRYLASSEVVILGGGYSTTGLWRYKQLGAMFDGEPGKFGRILHERRQRGLLTVGFSAGADQLSQHLFRRVWDSPGDNDAFGLARDTLVTLHHEPSRNGDLWHAARRMPRCFVFGLPNDAGIQVDWGVLPSGNIWQVYELIIDTSWDDPSDALHIKTRQGALIDHFDNTGRHWAFHGGDHIVRVTSQDGGYDRAWMTAGGVLLDYWTREPATYGSIDHILASH